MFSLLAYEAGSVLKNKFKVDILNPLLISIVIVSIFLFCLMSTTKYITKVQSTSRFFLLLILSLVVHLYEEIKLLRKNPVAIIAGILSGVLTSLWSVFLLSSLFGLNHSEYVTLLPKSITTAIGMPLSLEYGGYTSITIISI